MEREKKRRGRKGERVGRKGPEKMDTIVPGSLFDKSKELIIIPDVVIVLWAIVCVCVCLNMKYL